jgi:hypothetical protein
MRIELIRCEICRKEHDIQYVLPPEWITTKQTAYPNDDQECHFCSKVCLMAWVNEGADPLQGVLNMAWKWLEPSPLPTLSDSEFELWHHTLRRRDLIIQRDFEMKGE